VGFVVRDEKNRVILSIGEKGKVAASRYPDLTESCKDYIVDVYKELTNENLDEIRRFLNYEEEEDLFCS